VARSQVFLAQPPPEENVAQGPLSGPPILMAGGFSTAMRIGRRG